MALKVDTVDILKRYFSAVLRRTNHHALNVTDVIYRILGIIVFKKTRTGRLETGTPGIYFGSGSMEQGTRFVTNIRMAPLKYGKAPMPGH